MVDAPVDRQTAADAATQSDVERGVQASSRPMEGFAEGGDISIVVHADIQAG